MIESVPVRERAKKSNYSKSLYWVDQKRSIILKSILYNRHGKKAKRFYFQNIRSINGILVPMQTIVLNLETSRRTFMTYEKVILNTDVDDEFLTQRTLVDDAFRQRRLLIYQGII